MISHDDINSHITVLTSKTNKKKMKKTKNVLFGYCRPVEERFYFDVRMTRILPINWQLNSFTLKVSLKIVKTIFFSLSTRWKTTLETFMRMRCAAGNMGKLSSFGCGERQAFSSSLECYLVQLTTTISRLHLFPRRVLIQAFEMEEKKKMKKHISATTHTHFNDLFLGMIHRGKFFSQFFFFLCRNKRIITKAHVSAAILLMKRIQISHLNHSLGETTNTKQRTKQKKKNYMKNDLRFSDNNSEWENMTEKRKHGGISDASLEQILFFQIDICSAKTRLQIFEHVHHVLRANESEKQQKKKYRIPFRWFYFFAFGPTFFIVTSYF